MSFMSAIGGRAKEVAQLQSQMDQATRVVGIVADDLAHAGSAFDVPLTAAATPARAAKMQHVIGQTAQLSDAVSARLGELGRPEAARSIRLGSEYLASAHENLAKVVPYADKYMDSGPAALDLDNARRVLRNVNWKA